MAKPAIELTSRCNLSCIFCPYRIDNKNIPKGDMDFNLFTKLVDELAPQSEAIMLFNRGEPFLYPKIYEAISYVGRKTKVIISTNGILIGVDRFYKTDGIKQLVFSIPAARSDVYKQITGSDKFDVVKRNIQLAQNNKPENVELYCKIVKQPENEGHEEFLKEFCNHVVVVDDSNQPNIHNYTYCGQPDTVPTYDFTGKRKVCCRDEFSKYNFEEYAEQGRKRQLDICQKCSIR
ncbi:MAG TPA: radical SAM protein [Patescibacteria group bacterium]|nr:radical SAM protein [Patescibacteria group bacterium]